MMNISHKKYISLVIGFFLASFLGALTLSTLCELEIINYASVDRHSHEEQEQNADISRQYGLNHNEDTNADNTRNSGKNHTPNTAADECCNDVASTLESSLFSDVSKLRIPPAKFFVAGIIETTDFVAPLYHLNNSIFHEYDDPPPLTGFKLRVAIQSFLT